MFDTITGLPVHALVIHAVVVLLPLMAIITIVVSVRANLREKYMWWVTAANGVMFLVTLVAKQSGEALQTKLGGPQVAADHAALGAVLPWFALFFTLTSAAVAYFKSNRTFGPIAVVVNIIAAVLVLIWTIRTGDAGARAVWGR